jgi:acyl dehydratase
MLTVESPGAMKALVGQELGVSNWMTIDQDRINKFAEATGDFQWIHVDVERAKTEMPGGKTIAHGFLTLSLVAGLGGETHDIKNRSRGINYGSNKVRFTSPVPVGSRVRLRQKLLKVEDIAGGVRLFYENQIEIEGSDRPALIAETIALAYD